MRILNCAYQAALHLYPADFRRAFDRRRSVSDDLLIVYGVVILITVSLASEAFSDLAAAIRGALRRAAPQKGET